MSAPRVVCTVLARGGGSTLYRKNLYPLLGKPVIQWSLECLVTARSVTDVVVWSEDEDILDVARALGAVPLKRPSSMVHYASGFHSLEEWYVHRHQATYKALGYTGDYEMSFNCNNILVRPSTIDAMFATLRQSESWACRIQAYVRVEPGLAMTQPATGALFPFWNDPHRAPAEHPPLYRVAGIGIGNPKLCSDASFKPAAYMLAEDEGFDFQSREDIPFAEFELARRAAQEATP